MTPETSEVHFQPDLPADVVDSALASYLHNSSTPIEHQQMIQQKQYVEEHGVAKLTTTETEDTVDIEFTVGGEAYHESIPKRPGEVTAGFGSEDRFPVYDPTLIAICLDTGFPWADEVFVAYYDGTPGEEANERFDQKGGLFSRYIPPRGVYDEKQETHEDMLNTYHTSTLDMVTKMYSPPNPWTYAATAVPYENTELAHEVLQRSKWWGRDEYASLSVTYPDCLPDDA